MSEQDDYTKYRGKCKEMSEALVAADPTLRLVRGHYYDTMWGEQAHWWCAKPDGEIVDPTKDQFPSKGAGVYVEFSGIVQCDQCGKEMKEEDAIFMSSYPVCSNQCARSLVGV